MYRKEQREHRKMRLRDHSHIKAGNFVEYDEEQEEKQIESRSRRFWHKIDKRFFRYFTPNQLTQLQRTIMQEYQIKQQRVSNRQESYLQKNILSKNQRLFDKSSIKVLFQNSTTEDGCGDTYFVTFNFLFKQTDQYQSEVIQLESSNEDIAHFPNDINVTFMKDQILSQINIDKRHISREQEIQYLTTKLQLKYSKSSNDIDFLTQCNYFDLTKNKFYHNEIDRQIDLWNAELKKVEFLNQSIWQQMLYNLQLQFQQDSKSIIKSKIRQGYDVQQDILKIHQALSWKHNLVNIKIGFSDKNQQMLAQALEGMWIKQHKTNNMGEKKKFFKAGLANLMQTRSQLSNIFQTDCKVCFSTYVSDKNKVIYCDKCNQSFHEKCYGIQNLNDDPNSKFYCDACINVIDSTKKSQNASQCQICFVPYSPLKKIGPYFFHPSCLFLNNLLKPRLGNLQLQEKQTPQIIIQQVKQFQQSNLENQCEYCTEKCKLGLRFKCSEPNCNKYYHTLCGYLHACVFIIQRENQKLRMQVRCWQHYPQRDNIRQAYLRRFFCNYKSISDLSQNQFIQIYKEELQSIKQYKEETKNKRNKTKVKRKYNKVKEQPNSNTSVIDLNSEDAQNTSQNSHQTSLKRNYQNHLKNHQGRNGSTGQWADLDVDVLKKKINQIDQTRKITNVQNTALSLVEPYLSLIQMDLNEDFYGLKEDCRFLTDSNSNSHESDSFLKKIIKE